MSSQDNGLRDLCQQVNQAIKQLERRAEPVHQAIKQLERRAEPVHQALNECARCIEPIQQTLNAYSRCIEPIIRPYMEVINAAGREWDLWLRQARLNAEERKRREREADAAEARLLEEIEKGRGFYNNHQDY